MTHITSLKSNHWGHFPCEYTISYLKGVQLTSANENSLFLPIEAVSLSNRSCRKSNNNLRNRPFEYPGSYCACLIKSIQLCIIITVIIIASHLFISMNMVMLHNRQQHELEPFCVFIMYRINTFQYGENMFLSDLQETENNLHMFLWWALFFF